MSEYGLRKAGILLALTTLAILAGCGALSTPDNPWESETVTVGIDDSSDTIEPALEEAVAYWDEERIAEHSPYNVELEYTGEADADITVQTSTYLQSCRRTDDWEAMAGCPAIVEWNETVEWGNLTNEGFHVGTWRTKPHLEVVLRHKIGHTLNISHGGGPESIMANSTSTAANATERDEPWGDLNDTLLIGVRPGGYESVAEGDVTEAARQAAAEYDRIEYTENWTEAHVVVRGEKMGAVLPSGLILGGGSSPYYFGPDRDGDGSPEEFAGVHVLIHEVDAANVEPHIGYWLGWATGVEEHERPQEYQDPTG